jgi:hypothetical protein
MVWSRNALLVGSLCVRASSAGAEPLLYPLEGQNLVRVLAASDFDLSFIPLGLGDPLTVTASGSTELTSRQSGSAVTDVGLPDAFDGGAQGVYIESFDAHVDINDIGLLITDLFEPLIPLLPVAPPIPLVGAVALIDIADLDVSMVTPLSSSLISTAPNEYTWAGETALRISGSLNLSIWIPGQETIALGPVPFDQFVDPTALTGEFTGDAVSTTLVVGSPDAVVNPDTAPLIAEPLSIQLGALGRIEVTPRRLRLAVNGNFKAVNAEHGLPQQSPPPPPGPGCGIGPELAALLPLLGWRHRQRRSARY